MKTKLVSDENYLFLLNLDANKGEYNYEWEGNEILAYRKLKDRGQDLALPQLPKLHKKDNVEQLAEREAKFEQDPELPDMIEYAATKRGFIKGYEANQNKYTEEDLLKAFLAGIEAIKNLKSDDPSYELEVDYWNSFIKDISPILIPKDFIPEIDWTTPCKDGICKEEKNIVESKGEQYRGIDICSDGCVWAEPKLKIENNIVKGIYKY